MKSAKTGAAMQLTDIVLNRHGVRSQLSYRPRTSERITRYDEESLTVPDMTHSIQEILNRFTNGLSIPSSDGVYTDLDLSGLDRMSKFELIDLARQNKHYAQTLRDEIKREKSELDRKNAELELRAKIKAETEAEIEKQKQNSPPQA